MQDQKMKRAVDTVQECEQICLETLTYCLSKGGKHAELSHLQLLTDCVKICETAVHFMARGSNNHARVCSVCADMCEACAQSCRALEGDEMLRCAAACSTCAESCRQMAA